MVIAVVAVAAAIASCGGDSRQEDVAERGSEVMPFDLDATTHDFEPTPSGGVETVTADDPDDSDQVALVRTHLEQEGARFRAGDFGDPTAIHGEDMPGVQQLAAGAERIEIRYASVDGGASLTFSTEDDGLVAALHDWFEAQTTDHGEHAEPG